VIVLIANIATGQRSRVDSEKWNGNIVFVCVHTCMCGALSSSSSLSFVLRMFTALTLLDRYQEGHLPCKRFILTAF